MDHFLHRLREQISHCDWPKLVLFAKLFLHPSYIAIMNDQSGIDLYLMPHVINQFNNDFLMALMYSLVDGLREGDALRT